MNAPARLLPEDVADLVLQRTVVCLDLRLEELDDPIVQVSDSQIAHSTLRVMQSRSHNEANRATRLQIAGSSGIRVEEWVTG